MACFSWCALNLFSDLCDLGLLMWPVSPLWHDLWPRGAFHRSLVLWSLRATPTPGSQGASLPLIPAPPQGTMCCLTAKPPHSRAELSAGQRNHVAEHFGWCGHWSIPPAVQGTGLLASTQEEHRRLVLGTTHSPCSHSQTIASGLRNFITHVVSKPSKAGHLGWP